MTLIPVAEAQTRLFALARPVASETLPLRAAAGRWAAEDVLARRTQPAADLSAMDGYAIRFADLPGPWHVVGESAAGSPYSGTVSGGEATRIFTGAALPAGADTVLIQEEAARDHATLHLDGEGPAYRGRNTRVRGLDFHAGDLLLRAGDRLTPARVAVAATGGHGPSPSAAPSASRSPPPATSSSPPAATPPGSSCPSRTASCSPPCSPICRSS